MGNMDHTEINRSPEKKADQREEPDRRSFFRRLFQGTLGLGFLSLLGVAFAYILPPKTGRGSMRKEWLGVGKEGLIPLNGGKVVVFNGKPVWVLYLQRGFVAFSSICTHKACFVDWDGKRRVFKCPCHLGIFDTHGNVLQGLPRKPLPPYKVKVVEGVIYLGEA